VGVARGPLPGPAAPTGRHQRIGARVATAASGEPDAEPARNVSKETPQHPLGRRGHITGPINDQRSFPLARKHPSSIRPARDAAVMMMMMMMMMGELSDRSRGELLVADVAEAPMGGAGVERSSAAGVAAARPVPAEELMDREAEAGELPRRAAVQRS
jgi:hypothetical protein